MIFLFQFLKSLSILLTYSSCLRIALTAKLEAATKVLAEEKSSCQVVDQELRAAQESNSA
jgi:hypothetical protein